MMISLIINLRFSYCYLKSIQVSSKISVIKPNIFIITKYILILNKQLMRGVE